jgi:hypothetical protein
MTTNNQFVSNIIDLLWTKLKRKTLICFSHARIKRMICKLVIWGHLPSLNIQNFHCTLGMEDPIFWTATLADPKAVVRRTLSLTGC